MATVPTTAIADLRVLLLAALAIVDDLLPPDREDPVTGAPLPPDVEGRTLGRLGTDSRSPLSGNHLLGGSR